MNKFFIYAIALTAVIACNNGDKKTTSNENVVTTPADSLMKDIETGHDQAMSKMGKLGTMQKKLQLVLDSIATLPAKTQQTAEPYKRKLDSILEDLKSAKDNMMKWMDEFNMDSAVNDLQQRINYLTGEKLKIAKVKESMVSSLQKADSLIKATF